jgi:hypothetical protein
VSGYFPHSCRPVDRIADAFRALVEQHVARGGPVQLRGTRNGRRQACSAGVAMSAPPLMTTVLATTEASASYWSCRRRLGRKTAAVVRETVCTGDVVAAAAPLRAAPEYRSRPS